MILGALVVTLGGLTALGLKSKTVEAKAEYDYD